MNARDFDRDGLFHYRARYVRTIDGDTIIVMVDCGFSIYRELHVRLAGFNAAERYTPEGKIASQRMRDLFASDRYTGAVLATHYWPLRLVTEKLPSGDEATSFERYVATVWLLDETGNMTNLVDLLKARP